MKAVTEYPFIIANGGTFNLPTVGDYFRIQSSTGAISVTVEGVGTLPNLQSGQGIKNTPFDHLILRNTSGASVTGTILVATEEFIDNRTYGVNDLSAGTINTLRQPLQATGFYAQTAALAANTAEQIFSPASNLNGAILLQGEWSDAQGVVHSAAMLAKASAPVSVIDGQVIVASRVAYSALSNPTATQGQLSEIAFIPAGNGLYFISSGLTAGFLRSARFRLL